MHRKTVSETMLKLFLIVLIIPVFDIQPVDPNPTTIIVPDDYTTIQEAINNANSRDTVYVRAGTYYESIVVNRGISLIGEGRDIAIIDGNKSGVVAEIFADYVTLTEFTVRGGFGSSIVLNGSAHCNLVRNNIIVDNYHYYGCIRLHLSSNNIIADNNLTKINTVGAYTALRLESSDNNIIEGNNFEMSERPRPFPPLNGIHVSDNSANNNIISNNIINHWVGFRLNSYNNTIVGNNVTNNRYGFFLQSSNNTIYHNNVVDNYAQVYYSSANNIWDNGYPSGGNFWSDYAGEDSYNGPNQDRLGSDGIGDTPYVIDDSIQDDYPLMNPLYVARPHIPVTDPTISKFPFRLSLEPLGEGWMPDSAYRMTLYDIMGRTFDLLAKIAPVLGVDLAVKVWDFILADENGDQKLNFTEVLEQLKDIIEEELIWKIMETSATYYYQLSLSVTQQLSRANLIDLSHMVVFAAGSGVAYESLASLSYGGTSAGAGVPLVIPHPCIMMSLFGYEDSSSCWTLSAMAQSGTFQVSSLSPVDLTITDEHGRTVNKTLSEISGASYVETDLDGDSDLDDSISLPNGNQSYSLKVVPESGAQPNDTYTLIVGSDWVGYTLEENSTIEEILVDGYNITAYERLTVPDVSMANVTPSKTIVGIGFKVNLSLTVENQGDYTESFNISAYANSTIIQTQTITLSGGNSTTIVFSWNTTGYAKGNYIMSAVADTILGETETADNTYTYGTVLLTIPGDVNGDRIVEVYDLFMISKLYNSTPISPNWNPNADINNDEAVNTLDIEITSAHWGESQ